MPIQLKTPGVYIEEVNNLPSSIVRDAATVPLFVGYTGAHHGNLGFNMGQTIPTKAVRIGSVAEYVAIFGKAKPEAFTVAVSDTLDTANNLLSRTVSVTPPAQKSPFILYYAIQHYFANGGGPCMVISCADFGIALDGYFITNGLRDAETVEGCQLVVVPEMAQLGASYDALVTTLLTHCSKVGNRFAVLDVQDSRKPLNDATAFRGKFGNTDLRHGAAYYPHLESTIRYEYDPNAILVSHAVSGGTKGAYLQGKKLTELPGLQEDALHRNILQTLDSHTVTLPPSAAVAAQIVRTDRERGIWKAPANISLAAVKAPTVEVTQAEQESLNVDAATGKSINVIRTFKGQGILIWGARTLEGNSLAWRYVPVSRLFTMAEAAIKRGIEWAVFEPNDSNTWLRLKTIIENYLTGLWREGALVGAKPQEAFYVKVGLGTTMTSQDLLQGILRVEIGMAAVRPAEFIVLRVSQMMQQS